MWKYNNSTEHNNIIVTIFIPPTIFYNQIYYFKESCWDIFIDSNRLIYI